MTFTAQGIDPDTNIRTHYVKIFRPGDTDPATFGFDITAHPVKVMRELVAQHKDDAVSVHVYATDGVLTSAQVINHFTWDAEDPDRIAHQCDGVDMLNEIAV